MFLKVYSLETVVGFMIWEVRLNKVEMIYLHSCLTRTSPGSPTSGEPHHILLVVGVSVNSKILTSQAKAEGSESYETVAPKFTFRSGIQEAAHENLLGYSFLIVLQQLEITS